MAEQSLAGVLPDLFATGRIALLVLAVMLVEGVVLLALARRSGAVTLFPSLNGFHHACPLCDCPQNAGLRFTCRDATPRPREHAARSARAARGELAPARGRTAAGDDLRGFGHRRAPRGRARRGGA